MDIDLVARCLVLMLVLAMLFIGSPRRRADHARDPKRKITGQRTEYRDRYLEVEKRLKFAPPAARKITEDEQKP